MSAEQFYTVVFNDGIEQLFVEQFAKNSLPIFRDSLSIRKVVEEEGSVKMLKELEKAIKYAHEKTHIMSTVIVYNDGRAYSERENVDAEKFFDIDNYKIIPVNITY